MPTNLIIGCGYLGKRVAHQWLERGDEVAALTRSDERAARLRNDGIQPLIGDVTALNDHLDFPQAHTCLYAVGYDRASGLDRRLVSVDGLRRCIELLDGKLKQFVFISSTSVYGQDDGSFVDETSLTQPNTDNGQITLAAEQVVRELQPADGNWTILRLSGIYGPGRLLAKAEQLQSGQPLSGSPEAWLNLIHVDDAAQAVLAAQKFASPGSTYLITDNQPVLRREYYAELAHVIAAPQPVFDESLPGGRTSGLNKRLVNKAALRALHLTLCYPTFRNGLTNHSLLTG